MPPTCFCHLNQFMNERCVIADFTDRR